LLDLWRHLNPPQIQGSGCSEVINLQRLWRQFIIPASLPESQEKNRRVELLFRESVFLVPLKVFQGNVGIQTANKLDEGLIKRSLVTVRSGPGGIQQLHHRPPGAGKSLRKLI